MDKDLNLRRLNPFKTDINIVRHNFKNQSQQTDLRKHFPGGTLHNDVKYHEPIAKGEYTCIIRNALTELYPVIKLPTKLSVLRIYIREFTGVNAKLFFSS